MGNKNIVNYYDELAKNIKDPKATRNKAKDFSQFDIQLMKKLAGNNKSKTLLDLGAGTGLLVNHIIGNYRSITAVEKYPEFSKYISNAPNITVINQDLLKLKLPKTDRYDIISLFGVMNYFDAVEAELLYNTIRNYLNNNGIVVIKNQFGLKEDVIVNGYSEELKTNYYSEYRYIDNEVKRLKQAGFLHINVIDIYPPEYNRWANTHFYALVCSQSSDTNIFPD